MTSPSSHDSSTADSDLGLFAEFLSRYEAGEDDFDALCARYPARAARFRALWAALGDVGLVAGAAGGGDVACAAFRGAVPGPDEYGPYRVLERLGEGGMGVVYLAEQRAPVRRQVALKVIKLGMDSRQVLSRFEAERQALARMNHDHIARVLDAGTSPSGQPFFVMEHVPGLPLTEYCDRQRLSLEQRLELFRQVCLAVQHAHHKGVIHRDIKPGNILVSENQGRPVPKIIDFGLARATDHRLVEATLFTEHGQTIGTPEYMSPEQAEMSSADIDTRTDIYSLGVLLYELLVGELPYGESGERPALVEMQRRIREVDPPRPSSRLSAGGDGRAEAAARRATTCQELARQLRGDLDWITMKALEKDRNRRYATAAALEEDIGRYLADEPVLASPPSLRYRVGKLVRRYRVQVAAAAFGCAALLIGGIAATWFAIQWRVQAARAETTLHRYRDKVDEFNLIALPLRLRQALGAERKLYPAWPEQADAMGSWLHELARPLVRALGRVRAAVHDASGAVTDEGAIWPDSLQQLERGILDLRDRLVPDVERRMAWASQVRALSIGHYRERWQRACEGVAHSEAYRSGRPVLRPQVGLVPIGENPVTHLWEFYHLASAADPTAIPSLGADGSIAVGEDTGMVFVLLPGGTFLMGSDGGDGDVWNQDREGPVHSVTLAPFFMARHELMQGQWIRMGNENTSEFNPNRSRDANGKSPFDLRHPVENVAWRTARDALARQGLLLPTEAQWEYACRAGTRTAWWTGSTIESLIEGGPCANVVDSTVASPQLTTGGEVDPRLDDGYNLHAPVGSFRPNPWGLYDVHGNVWEWCRDVFLRYWRPVRPGDGLREAPPGVPDRRIYRGGSFNRPIRAARSAYREWFAPEVRVERLGVRASRAVQ